MDRVLRQRLIGSTNNQICQLEHTESDFIIGLRITNGSVRNVLGTKRNIDLQDHRHNASTQYFALSYLPVFTQSTNHLLCL